jgi:hypothetical protein
LKRDVSVQNDKIVVRAAARDAIAKVRRAKLVEQLSNGKPLTDAQRDLALVAILQALGVVGA